MKLSICIPTYNRAGFIAETIVSVIEQATNEVEIVVSDNASADNTREVVAELQRRFPRIIYGCNAENLGAARNAIRTIELATGDYCWFLGSDDKLAPGAISIVLKALNEYPNLGGLHVRNASYSFDMTQRLPDGNPLLYRCRQTQLFEDAEECYAEIGPYFSLCSGQIYNRRVVMEVINAGEWQDFCAQLMPQFYIIGATLKRLPRWLFIYNVCVYRRTGNITFREDEPAYVPEDIVKDLEAVTAYGERVARTLFGTRSVAYHAALRTGAAFAYAPVIAEGKLTGKLSLATTFRLLKLGLKYYARYPVFWIKALPILLMPTFILGPVRSVYRAILERGFGPHSA